VEVAALVDKAVEAKHAGDLDSALQLVSEAVKARPENPKANWVGAWILASKGDTALAIGQFERVSKLGLDEKQSKMAAAALKRLKARDE
jgi:lipopolysaccharide biosynthesis regulator YciM